MEHQTTNSFTNETESNTIREIIIRIQQWFHYLLRKWIIILTIALLSAALAFVFASMVKPRYLATLRFVLEENKQSPMGAYAGIASQFGIDLGGAGSGVFTSENIIEFLRSRMIIEKTLLSNIDAGSNGKITLADYYRSMQAEKPVSPVFSATQPRNQFSRTQDSILSNLYETVLNTNLTVQKPDKKVSFIQVDCITTDEKFSKLFAERLVQEASSFYILTKTANSRITVNKLQAKADSLQLLLTRKTYAVAQDRDLNLNPARQVGTVPLELASMDKMLLQTMYAEVVKNLEITRLSMANETPIIQLIDTPVYPLKKVKLGKVKALVIGGCIGGLLAMIVLLVIRLYKQIMHSGNASSYS